ncbi:helix-turn-helix transcriptional regulator [Clostridium botulinum]|nr:helix-turn-helix transcriptional regulator [Clostridium botulinum]NFN20777.1 helix-turn-helix transcriptional regulator [Clostridium botulinum]NFN41995.1 helix-turn-helix transcriptional regulator [Clostridium botulinum]
MTIADAIREYRENQGITQSDLAIKINKTVRMIKRYEKGDTIPSLRVLGKIFDKSIHEIIYQGIREI